MNESWKRFVNGEVTPEQVEPVIYRSWQRSQEFQVSFERIVDNELLPAHRLRERCEAQEDLLRSAQGVLPDIFNLLNGQNFMMLLCDAEGYVLDSLGDPPFMSKAQQVYLSPGASWREDVKGTNAIGTALAENVPLKVLGWEHFVQENHFLACWAAPVRNFAGQVVGVFDISGCVSYRNKHILELAIMSARMIEQNLQLLELNRNHIFFRQGMHLAGEMLREGFIAIDKSGVISVINQAGAQLLGRKREEIIGQPAMEVFRSTKGWTLQNETMDFKLTGPSSVISRLRQVMDSEGNTMGAVGILAPSAEPEEKPAWVGRSEVTRQVFERSAKAATTTSSVLILGESGTGKEVVARYIHQLSARRNGPFVALNCAALPHSLVESELFGYDDGAFTGARRGGKPGKFELAHGGTIFLDEIGDMPQDTQAALLRVLQEKEVLRIGDSKSRRINVRVIAATHKNLPAAVAGGLFRLDLYYRLKVVSIELPPLRNRIEDIWDLVPLFVQKACCSLGKPPMRVDEGVYGHLATHHWPGNIRELENCIESMVALAEGEVLTAFDLPPEFRVEPGCTDDPQEPFLQQQTKQAILQALSQTKGKIAPAARLLGIGRNTLYRKIKELNIKL